MFPAHVEQVLRGPCCGVRMRYGESEIACVKCDQRYPVRLGIPDLRWPRPDRELPELAQRLIERYSDSSFAELVNFEIGSLSVTDRLKQVYQTYRFTAVERGAHLERMFWEHLSRHFQLPGRGAALSMGCGSGASLPAMSREFGTVYGVDPFLPDLILALKLCEEYGLENVVLIQAVGQNLPFASGVLDYASGQNVIEHLSDVEGVLHEVRRALRAMGCFCADSRNRFDLFLPEPHVRLRWVGFWPRRLMPGYVRVFRGVNYDGIRLLSLQELQRALRRSFDERWVLTLPNPSAYGHSARWDRILAKIRDYPVLRGLLLQFFPSHLVLAQAT